MYISFNGNSSSGTGSIMFPLEKRIITLANLPKTPKDPETVPTSIPAAGTTILNGTDWTSIHRFSLEPYYSDMSLYKSDKGLFIANTLIDIANVPTYSYNVEGYGIGGRIFNNNELGSFTIPHNSDAVEYDKFVVDNSDGISLTGIYKFIVDRDSSVFETRLVVPNILYIAEVDLGSNKDVYAYEMVPGAVRGNKFLYTGIQSLSTIFIPLPF